MKMFILYNIIYISLCIFLAYKYKLSLVYLTISVFSIIAIDLFMLNQHLGFSVLVLFLVLTPFIPKKEQKNTDNINMPQTQEDLEYYLNFKDFLSEYLDILKEKYHFTGVVVYERKENFYKLIKIYPLSSFHFVKNAISFDSPIITALKQFNEDVKLSTSDQIISKMAQIDSESLLKTRSYLNKEHLVTIFSGTEITNDVIPKINNFLNLFRYIKNQFDLKTYHDALFTLSKNLNLAITKKDVLIAFFKVIKEYINFDCAIFTSLNNSEHIIEKVLSEDTNIVAYEDKQVDIDTSVINLVLKNKHYLPTNGKFDFEKNVLLNNKSLFENYKSLISFPIMEQENAIGTISLLSKDFGKYDEQVISILKVMFNMLDISLFNAKIYQKMEEMATTDGLTGLINHRTFQEKIIQYLQRAKRYNKKVGIVLTDIDHFKSVNDSYGHPMGDEVLRKVASLLKKSIRNVDLVARYGGEEFVIILEETEKDAIYTLTNRIREELKQLEFHSNGKSFRISISMGFSIYPNSSEDKQQLIDLADKALYFSKKNGRDQVNYIGDIKN